MPYCGAGLPPNCMIKVKLKIGEQWFDTPGSVIVSGTSYSQDGITRCNLLYYIGHDKQTF